MTVPLSRIPVSPWVPRRTPVSLIPSLGLLLVAVGGRYSLSRGGAESLTWLDLRLLGLGLTIPFVLVDLRRVRDGGRPAVRDESWLVATCVFFLYQIGSGYWAPPDARAEAVVDVLCTAGLAVGLYLHARPNPELVLRRALWVVWGTGLVFALGALLLGGAGAQGRYAAFGGGPNVFVRLQVLGLVATAALVVLGARRIILLAVPLFVVSAVLSGSRGGLAAAGLVGLGVVLTGGPRARRAGLLAFAAGAASVAVAAVLWSPVRELVTTRFVEQTTVQGYDSNRTQIWSGAVTLFREHPVVGSGLDGYFALVGRYSGVEYPHDYVLAVAAEGGLVGLGLLTLAVSLWGVTLHRSRPVGTAVGAMVASAAFVALASLFSGDYYDARLAWCFAALAAAAAGMPAAEQSEPVPLEGRALSQDPRVEGQRGDELR